MTLTSTAALRLGISTGFDRFRAFGRWWLKEFLALFPERVADWLIEGGSMILVLAPEEDAVTLQLLSDRRRAIASVRVDRAEYSPDSIDAFLRSQRLRRSDVSLGITLTPSSIFSRSFALPLETRRSLDAIVVQDLLAKTPFQLDGIVHAHVARRTADRFLVWQWVVRRKHVAEALEALGLEPSEVAFLGSSGARADDGPVPMITLQQAAANQNRWVRRVSLTLAATALALAIAAMGTKFQHQQQLLDNLAAEVTGTREKAKGVVAAISKLEKEQARLQRLRANRSEPGLLDIWEEATRMLPSHTWLSELRLSETPDGRHVVMTGFSAAAASLVGLLDRSPLFGEASLAGSISIDQAEKKERFIIQVKVNKRTASR
jgi:general secretion pathway protein L